MVKKIYAINTDSGMFILMYCSKNTLSSKGVPFLLVLYNLWIHIEGKSSFESPILSQSQSLKITSEWRALSGRFSKRTFSCILMTEVKRVETERRNQKGQILKKTAQFHKVLIGSQYDNMYICTRTQLW